MTNIAINGFGRIGRLAFRVATMHHEENAKIVAINTSGSMTASGWMNLVKYDTTYKQYPFDISAEDLVGEKDLRSVTPENPLIGYITANGKKYPVLAVRDPEQLPWKEYEVDTVIESTGIFVKKDLASKHIKAGAKHVVISAPGKGGDIQTYVRGVNETGNEEVISNASCTTNCLSPVAHILHTNLGIKKALMSTVHGYTDDQRLQDNSHDDLRRARAAAANIVPTTTGAAKATTEVIPDLKGMFDGMAIRVPVLTGSLIFSVFLVNKPTSIEEINEMYKKAAKEERYQGILAVTDEPIVSSDIVGQPYSATVDLSFTNVIDGDLVQVVAWYDNEWGYTNRLVEQAIIVGMSNS